ncbi:pyridoxal-phosphate-dependent aminotransferase family protein [Alkaliphilus serpentinus]|uniref:Alanine--glyoxylate aminotransferase family protein n=1 Tax=Alkaliphilus serpentinus TaxID=1482731 RepID=A0A833M9R3_9FIRM|nr:alanine--glyoxylate aminotransferase family protein [Alkaliphilus serpentinus]KAB3529170.1 alanine--glyoxylate aminotransferase family protein [Alkaliphilus serpentinus]
MNKKLVMIPGPTPVVRSIQDQMGRETVAFGDPAFVKDYKELIDDLKLLWKTEGEVFVIAGTGTLAMEMAIANTTKAGDNVLIISQGFFGDRFIDLCQRKGLKVDVLASEWGDVVPLAEIEAKLKEKKYSVVTVTHVDTATGVVAPIEEIGKLIRGFKDTLYIVDGVCATAAEPEYVDEMGIDVLLTGSQKAFGVAPGIAVVWAGPRAMERRKSLGTIPEFYIDFDKWLPIMKDPSKYFATPAVNLIWAMKEAVQIIKEEGLEKRYLRHKKNAKAVQSALLALGFKILAKEGCRAVSLSNVIYPEGINDLEFRKILAEEGIVVAGGLGPYAGKLFRLGHMGNIDTHDLVSAIATIERALYRVGYHVELGKGVGVLMKGLLD